MEKQRARTNDEKELKRQKILISAKKIFSEYGFQNTKVNMITKDAGLSPAAFYLYFKSKVEIYRLLSIEGTNILSQMIQKALKSRAKKATTRISALAGAYFNFFLKEREFYEIITVHHLGQRDFFINMKLVPRLEALSLELLNTLSTIIKSGIENDEFRKVDIWKTAVSLWGMMDGVLLLEVRKTTGYINLDINDLTEHFLSLCLHALKKQS